jgi:hypothetical protein
MNAIIEGCNSPLVRRLRYTFGDMDKTAKEALETMVPFGDKDSFSKYRIELDRFRNRGSLIPDVGRLQQRHSLRRNLILWPAGVHSQDIRNLWDEQKCTLHTGGERFINFEHCINLTDKINGILSFKKLPIDLERYRDNGPLAYLECQLDKFEVTEEKMRTIESRSEKLQKIEEIIYKGRYREVKLAGFGDPIPKRKR